MKIRWFSVIVFSLTLLVGLNACTAASDSNFLKSVEHFVQSTVKISGDMVVYFDPFQIEGEPHDADLIFITHTHPDHLSLPDIKDVLKTGTTVVATSDAKGKLEAAGVKRIVAVAPNLNYEVAGIKIATIPAYNGEKPFHPKTNNWVGYIIQLNGCTYYMAGDTDGIPEMTAIQVDVAFLPVGGTYTMGPGEAAEAANRIKPKIAVPIHFADAVGTWEDAEKFLALLDPEIRGNILKQR